MDASLSIERAETDDRNVTPNAILDFWFGAPGRAEYGKSRAVWFMKDPGFDNDVQERFTEVHAAAAAGRLTAWESARESALALVIVLDQFSRNLFRSDRAAFASDAQALRVARDMIAKNWDTALLPVKRMFVYLPFEHSENLADQQESVRLFRLLARESGMQDLVVWAEKHCEVIHRFGRFPHRNEILSRASTPDELSFLGQPGSSF